MIRQTLKVLEHALTNHEFSIKKYTNVRKKIKQQISSIILYLKQLQKFKPKKLV